MAFDTTQPAQLTGLQGYTLDPLFTVGDNIPTSSGGTYTPPGILDGLGAFALNATTVRVLAVHEIRPDRGYAYNVSNGSGGQFSLTGARISYFDVDKATLQITDAGLAYSEIYDANGTLATSASFLHNNFPGFSRFCSAQLVEAQQFGAGKGLADRIFFANEETGGSGDSVGGAVWALDTANGEFWHVPAFGRGGWENVTEVDTGTTTHVAFILSDDTSPFNVDGDTPTEAAPLYLYVGQKNANGNFLEKNGLSGGKLYVWVPSDPSKIRPENFNTNGATLAGSWVEIDNSRNQSQASETGANGYDEYGYPTQKTLWQRAEAAGAFQFSRPEDVATNPANGQEFVLASTGVANLETGTAGAGDTDGTLYTMTLNFTTLTAPTGTLKVLYSGDTDATEALRNPDNLDWADDGYIYVQEDRANGATLFSAVNSNEAGIVRINPTTGQLVRIANIDRSALPSGQTDTAATDKGNWESSGIVDVSKLFGKAPGTLFLADVQAHSITNQGNITNTNLVEGGQLLLLKAPGYTVAPTDPPPANTLAVTTKGTVTGTGSEIVAHDPGSQRLFVVSGTNTLEILDIASGTPSLLSQTIDVATVGGLTGGTANSVAVKNGLVAVAVQDGTKTNNGVVAFYNASDLALIKTVTVGALPDMLTFTPDGKKVLVANEGESSDSNNLPTATPNPEGSISIIDLTNGAANATETKITFSNVVTTLNGQVALNGNVVLNDKDGSLIDGNVRFSPGVFTGALTPAQDLEPEYIAVSPDGTRAFVTLQENNAFAILDLTTNSLVTIKPLWSTNPVAQKLADLDSSDRDSGTYFRDWSSLPIYSLYMPDSVASFTGANGQTYFITANEGDARGEDGRISTLNLDSTAFPDAAYLKQDDKLGRLNASSTDGDTDGDGDYDELYVYGDRSFAIWDTNGNLVFDSGSQLEAIVAQTTPTLFNANNGLAAQVDTRSDDKGPEPEAVTVGMINGVPYGFVGLERAGGGVLIYNLSDPTNPVFDQYIRTEGDIGPEGFKFISAAESPTGKPLLAVANEVSKTTTLYGLEGLTPPVFAQDAYEFTLQDDAEDGDEVGEPIAASDGDDGDSLTYSITDGNEDPDGDGNKAFAIIDTSGQITVNDADDLALVDVFNLTVTATDSTDLTDTTAVSIEVSKFEETSTPGIFSISSLDIRNLVINANNNLNVNIGIFFVDDALGSIDNLKPGDDGYLQAAASRALSLLAALSSTDNPQAPGQLKKVLELQSAAELVSVQQSTDFFFGFLSVKDVSLGDLFAIANGLSGSFKLSDLDISLSTEDAQATDDGEGNFSITLGGFTFNVTFDSTTIEETFGGVLGINLDGDAAPEEIVDEVIAQCDTPGKYTITGSIFREAAYNNTIGFFLVNADGAVLDSRGNAVATPDNLTNYKAAIVANLITENSRFVQYQVSDNTTLDFSFGITTIQSSVYVLPVLAVQGNFTNFSDIYYPIITANSDKVDHMKFQGVGATGNGRFFGFEDLKGGGDKDFDDFIVQVNISPVL